jgi:hypothetical protein
MHAAVNANSCNAHVETDIPEARLVRSSRSTMGEYNTNEPAPMTEPIMKAASSMTLSTPHTARTEARENKAQVGRAWCR